MFFNSPDLNLFTAIPGSYTLMPNAEMSHDLSRDYNARIGMIFGEPPTFEDILNAIQNLENRLNDRNI